jgi:hypothetical protein
MHRPSLSLALAVALTALSAPAASATAQPSLDLSLRPDAAEELDLSPKPVQFLDRTVVRIPTVTGKYTLLDTNYEAEHIDNGVSTQWRVAGAPAGLILSVYAYPIGRAEEKDAVQREIAKVATVVQIGVAQGLHVEAVAGERVPFVVVRGESMPVRKGDEEAHGPFDPAPKPEARPALDPKADPVAKLWAENWRTPNSHGIRQAFSLKHDGVTMRSLAYVFHRHLFGFKVRISVPASAMEQAAFEQLADAATRWLVPQVDVRNFGTCGEIIVTDADFGNDERLEEQRVQAAIVRGFTRVAWENCAPTQAAAPEPKGVKKVEIVYPPGTWAKM